MTELNDIFSAGMKEDDASGSIGRFSVTELTRTIKGLLEENIPVVAVEGELSNYIHHASGHRYFTLKDEYSQLKCVMFKWQAQWLDFTPEEGMKLLAVGNVTVYERSGQYQLNVKRLSPLGRGELLARLEELKQRLAKEGIFENKRRIPSYPKTIGVVTSPTGAAVRDIISVINRRAPQIQIILRPTLVQGKEAASDIVKGIQELNTHTAAEVLIVGRGGGSIEDLWCFNEEVVARAIASSPVPVISAVGHETDFTIADFAADLRAPTPSAAAELAVEDSKELKETITGYMNFLKRRILMKVDNLAQRVISIQKRLSPELFMQVLMLRSQTVDELTLRIKSACTAVISEQEKTLERLTGKLAAMDPSGVLCRGYSIVYRESDHSVVTDQSMVSKGEYIDVELSRGAFSAEIEHIGKRPQ